MVNARGGGGGGGGGRGGGGGAGGVTLYHFHMRHGTAFPTRLHVGPAKTKISLRVDAQADLSLRWVHIQACRKCRAPAHILTTETHVRAVRSRPFLFDHAFNIIS